MAIDKAVRFEVPLSSLTDSQRRFFEVTFTVVVLTFATSSFALGAVMIPPSALTNPSAIGTEHSKAPVLKETLPTSGRDTLPLGPHSRAKADLAAPLSTGTWGDQSLHTVIPFTSSNPYYFQEGATFSQFDGDSQTYSSWYFNITLVTSPYATGYEFNSLSNTGDWYQVLVGYKWPGCSSGFEMLYSSWNDTGSNSGGTYCDSTVTLTAGNKVALDTFVDATGSYCNPGQVGLEVFDWNTSRSSTDCVNQPDPGSSPTTNYFVTLGTSANSNGYFSGPMTEVVDTTASSCNVYSSMPSVTYKWTSDPSELYVSEYIPWSDEFQSGGSLCYSYAAPVVTQPTSYHSSIYTETNPSGSFGNHWEASTNVSTLGDAWTLKTDSPPTSPATTSITASRTSSDLTQSITLTPSTLGGSSPYTYYWYVNGAFDTSTSGSLVYLPPSTGTYSVLAYTQSNGGNMYGPSQAVTFTVFSDPSVGSPSASLNSGKIDVGQSVTFTSAAPTGGLGPYTYSWTALPSGCVSSGASTDNCSPTGAGSFAITVKVTDANGYPASGTLSPYVVYPDPWVSPPIANRTSLDVGQSVTFTTTAHGGPGTYTYYWTQSANNLGCTLGNAISIQCVPTSSGNFSVTVYVVDGNSYTSVVNSSATYRVYADPAVSTPNPTRSQGDVGQSVNFSTTASLGDGVYSYYTWTVSPATGLGCSASTTSVLKCNPVAVGNYSVSVTVTDSNGFTSTTATFASYRVYSDPSVSSISSTPTSGGIDAGQTVTFASAIPAGGLAPYAYSWTSLPTGCANSGASSDNCVPTNPGSYTVTLRLTDSNGYSTSVTLSSYVVDADPWVSVPVGNRTTLDVGQSIAFTTSAHGGPGTYSYHWTQSGVALGCALANAPTIDCVPTAAGNFTVIVYVVDGNSYTSASNSSLNLRVYSDPVVTIPSPTRTQGDINQPVNFSTVASLGTGNYTSYAWTVSPATGLGCTSSMTLILRCVPTTSGNYTVSVTVTDSNGFVSAPASSVYRVYSDPAVSSISAVPPSGRIDLGQTANFTSASPTGGASPYSYSWLSLPTGCSDSHKAFDLCTPTSSGSFTVQLQVTDANGYPTTVFASYTVDGDPYVSALVANRTNVDVGQTVVFNATASGGSGSYATFAWSWSSAKFGCTATTSPTLYCTPTTPGSAYTVSVTVTDSNGFTSNPLSSAPYTVLSDPTVSPPGANRTSTDVGQPVTFSTVASGGDSPYLTYLWTSSSPSFACGASSTSSITCNGGTPGNYSVTVQVVDSNHFTSTAATSTLFRVYSDPLVTVPIANRTTVDVGQTVSYATTASGGTASYTSFVWSESSPNLGCTLTNTASISCVPTLSGSSYTVTVTVVDSNGGSSAASTSSAYTVYADPVASVPSPSVPSVDIGQNVTFQTTATLGTLSYTTYVWAESSPGLNCTLGNSRSITCYSNVASASYWISVYVIDSNGVASPSVKFSPFPVYSDPIATAPLVSPNPVDLGQAATFTGSVTGGSGGFTWLWSGLPAGCPSSGSTVLCKPSSIGNWTVSYRVNDSNGWVSPSSPVVFIVHADPKGSFSPGSNQTNESGQTNNFTASATLGTLPYAYQWRVNGTAVPGATSNIFAFYTSHPATYLINVTIKDTAGWVVWTPAVQEIVTPGPSVTLSENLSATDVGIPVAFTSTHSGGIAPYTWSYYLNGTNLMQSGQLQDWNHTFTGAATYTVVLVLTDSDHAHVNRSVTLVVNALPRVAIATLPAAVDIGMTANVTSTIMGGTGPYVFSWYLNNSLIAGASLPYLNYTPVGVATYSFNLSVRDAFGHLAWATTLTLTVNPDPRIQVSSPRSTLDVGQVLNLTAVPTQGTPGYACYWTVNGSVVGGATSCTSFAFAPSGPGPAWTVQAFLSDADGFRVSSSVLHFQVDPTLRAIASAFVLQGDANQTFALTGTVSGGTPGYSCQWQVGGSPVAGATNCTGFSYRPTAAGSFSVTLKVTDTVAASVASTPVLLTIRIDPILALTINTPEVDVGETINVSANATGGWPAYTCVWFINGSISSGTGCTGMAFPVSGSGNYTVNATLRDSVGFVYSTLSYAILAYVPPHIVASAPGGRMDAGQSIVLNSTVSGGASPVACQWFENGSAIAGATSCLSFTFSPAGPGTYLFFVMASDSAVPTEHARSGNLSIVVYSALSATVTPVAAQTDVGLGLNLSLTASGGASTYHYAWFVNGTLVAGATGAQFDFTPAGAGTYTVMGSVTDSTNATRRASATVTVQPTPTVQLSPTGTIWLDLGQSVIVRSVVLGGTPPMMSYLWTLNGIPQTGTASPSFNFSASSSGSYSLSLEVTDAVGVQVKSLTLVIQVETLVVTITPVSQGESGVPVSLSANVVGGTGPYLFAWSIDGKLVSSATGSVFDWVPGAVIGTTTISVTVGDSHNITASRSEQVSIVSAVSVSVTSQSSSLDVGQNLSFKAAISGGAAPFDITWLLNGNPIAGVTGPSYLFHPSSAGAFSITARVTDALGGTSTSLPLQISVTSDPAVQLSVTASTIDTGQSTTLTSIVDFGIGPFTWAWFLNGTLIPGANGAEYNFTPQSVGTYSFTVQVTDKTGMRVSSNVVMVGVTPPSTTPGGKPGTSFPWWLLLVAIAVVLGIVVLVVLARRRRVSRQERGAEVPSAYETGSGGPAPVTLTPAEGVVLPLSTDAPLPPAISSSEPVSVNPTVGPAQAEVPHELDSTLEKLDEHLNPAPPASDEEADQAVAEVVLGAPAPEETAPATEGRRCFICGNLLEGDFCPVCLMHWDPAE